MLLCMYQSLVGVYNLFQVDGLFAVMRECRTGIEFFVSCGYRVAFDLGFDDHRCENPSCEITAVGDKVDGCVERALHLFQRLLYFGHVLVLKGLVYAQVIVAPREVGGGTGPLPGTGRAGDGINSHVLCQQSHFSCG